MSMFSTRVARGASAFTIALGLVLSLVAFPVASSASTAHQAAAPASVTVPAGGSVNLTIRGFCLDFGKTFPTGDIQAKALADAKVREALNYAIQKGYTDSNARQVELAIWNIRDNTWHADPHDIGTEIVNNATSANDPVAGTGTSVVDAIASGTLTATAKFVPQTADEFYGDGQVTLKNTGASDLSVYMPVGVTFSTGDSSFQDLVAYQLSVPAQATGTVNVTGTASPAASATSVVTGTATTVATGTVEATTTSVVTGTATTAVTTPSTISTAATTPTVEETATTAPVETATTAPVSTDTPVATATPAPSSGVLPQTGSGDGTNGLALAILLMGIMLTIVGSTALVISKRRA